MTSVLAGSPVHDDPVDGAVDLVGGLLLAMLVGLRLRVLGAGIMATGAEGHAMRADQLDEPRPKGSLGMAPACPKQALAHVFDLAQRLREAQPQRRNPRGRRRL